jgi:hypothetical protein
MRGLIHVFLRSIYWTGEKITVSIYLESGRPEKLDMALAEIRRRSKSVVGMVGESIAIWY